MWNINRTYRMEILLAFLSGSVIAAVIVFFLVRGVVSRRVADAEEAERIKVESLMKVEQARLQAELDHANSKVAELQESNPDYARVVTELASTEVIEHNHKMLAMTREAEQNQRSQIHSRKKNEQSL